MSSVEATNNDLGETKEEDILNKSSLSISEKVSIAIQNVIETRTKDVKGWLLNYGLKAGVGTIIWFIGYSGMSVWWILVGVFTFIYSSENFFQKKRTNKIIKTATEDKSKLIEAVRSLYHQSGNSLPSWIYFPDVEKVEWFNRILHQLWPSINIYFKDIISDVVAPSIRSSHSVLSTLKFTEMDLGKIAPQIIGIKVYKAEETSSDEIVMDLQLMYSSECNIEVNLNHLSAGVCDLILRGLIRVEMKPILNKSPFIGAIGISFVHDPMLDFNMTNLGNFLDLPGIDSLLRRSLIESIRDMMVYPQKLIFPLLPDVDVSLLKFPLPEGILRVHVLEAKDLVAKDTQVFQANTSDPYVVVTACGKKQKTAVVSSSVNPRWNESFDFIVHDVWHSSVSIELFDDDGKFNADDELGRASIPIKEVYEKAQIKQWVDLCETKHGKVLMKFEWMELSRDVDTLELALASDLHPNTSSSLISLQIDDASDLPSCTRDVVTSQVQVKVSILGESTERETKFVDFNHPVWDERFLIPISDPRHSQIKLQIFVNEEVTSDLCNNRNLGHVILPIDNLLQTSQMSIEGRFDLNNSAPNSKLKLRVALRILKLKEKPEEENGDENLVTMTTPSQPVSITTTEPADNAANQPSVLATSEPAVVATSEPPVIATHHVTEDVSNDNLSTNNNHRTASIASFASVLSETAFNRDSNPDIGMGRIKLTIRVVKRNLVVFVHKAENLIVCDENNRTSDPYVKVSIQGQTLSQKTKVVKKSLNPIFEQRLSFQISDASSSKLKVSVKNSTGFLSSEKKQMGSVAINLSTLTNLSTPQTSWFALH